VPGRVSVPAILVLVTNTQYCLPRRLLVRRDVLECGTSGETAGTPRHSGATTQVVVATGLSHGNSSVTLLYK